MKSIAVLAAALLATATAAQAVTIYGVTSANVLIRFDSTTPGTVIGIGAISTPGIVDIDFYPVNGLLYAINSTGSVYTLNLTNASATLAITPLAAFDGSVTDFDFNPSADRLRIYTTGATTENYRMVPDVLTNNPGTAGTITPDGNFSDAAAVLVGQAYTNNIDGTATTSLYSIDTTANTLVLHSGTPQFNTITAVGSGLGVAVGSNVGFDVDQSGTAYLSDDNSLYTVDLTTGLATAAGTVATTGLRSIAAQAVPEPSTAVFVALGLAGLISRRQRE